MRGTLLDKSTGLSESCRVMFAISMIERVSEERARGDLTLASDIRHRMLARLGDDIVRISSPPLGTLVNRVRYAEDCEPWDFGVRSLMGNLAKRGLL